MSRPCVNEKLLRNRLEIGGASHAIVSVGAHEPAAQPVLPGAAAITNRDRVAKPGGEVVGEIELQDDPPAERLDVGSEVQVEVD